MHESNKFKNLNSKNFPLITRKRDPPTSIFISYQMCSQEGVSKPLHRYTLPMHKHPHNIHTTYALTALAHFYTVHRYKAADGDNAISSPTPILAPVADQTTKVENLVKSRSKLLLSIHRRFCAIPLRTGIGSAELENFSQKRNTVREREREKESVGRYKGMGKKETHSDCL